MKRILGLVLFAALSALLVGYLLYNGLYTRLPGYFYILAFTVGSIVFFYSADHVLNNVMEPHQRTRINVLLGLDEDLAGAGYNVHQSEIAIGSGGLRGKGFLNGTQTKLKFVPEQDTDFIFCTVGEEEGFVGAAGVLLLFLAQQRDDAIEFDPHDLYILFRGRYRLAPGRSDAPAVFSTRCIL